MALLFTLTTQKAGDLFVVKCSKSNALNYSPFVFHWALLLVIPTPLFQPPSLRKCQVQAEWKFRCIKQKWVIHFCPLLYFMSALQIIFNKQQIFLPTWGVMQLLILLLRPILFIVIQYHLHMLYVAMLLFVL